MTYGQTNTAKHHDILPQWQYFLSQQRSNLIRPYGIDDHKCIHVHDFNWPLRDVQVIQQKYFETRLLIYIFSTCCGISLKVVSWKPPWLQSILVQVVAWCHQAASHCWSQSFHGINIPPQWLERELYLTPDLNCPVATVPTISSLSLRQWQRQDVRVTDAQSLRLILYARLRNGPIYQSSISVKSVISWNTASRPEGVAADAMYASNTMTSGVENVPVMAERPLNRPRPHPLTYPRTVHAAFWYTRMIESATVVATWFHGHGVMSNSTCCLADREAPVAFVVRCQNKFVNSLRPWQLHRGIYSNRWILIMSWQGWEIPRVHTLITWNIKVEVSKKMSLNSPRKING